ncbi:Enoyl-[acyl-carrier-protein] reductase [NADPH] FabL [Planctomycetes bacterium CA13]|uniref:Enoyl-[acyl-carrier-protein] reductase [NADPH] FabL n=1 Tax=Novipirellula herctigrandis TaxID=2527986 RepID=A0A5C5YVZ2_9BACT|nr:Enoyl-[acyl-carrier-protein] reductase [NADPH] FabL [Planctomycetes bacterium CA13]
MIDLTGKVALVSGSSRGIGRATAIRLAEAGADIVINYVTSRAAAMEVAQAIISLGRQVWVVKADVSESEDVEAMMQFVKSEIGRLDIIVSNAATGGFRNLLAAGPQHFNTAMQTNVMSLVHLVREAKDMLTNGSGRGKVIAISSHGADIALPMYGLIGGSKAALESISRHLALELGDEGINVNIVKAGLVETDSTRRLPGADQMFEGRKQKSMVGDRFLVDRDVANAVLFLASPLSDMVQGETLTVDGGSAVHV